MEEEKFTLLRRFQYSSEAVIYQGKLESHGIEVFLRDINTIDSNPLYSNLLGGIKLFVKTEDVAKASEILSDVSLYSVADDHKAIQCPKCGSEEIDMVTSVKDWKSLLYFLVLFFAMLFPINAKHKYKCESCKHEFNQEIK